MKMGENCVNTQQSKSVSYVYRVHVLIAFRQSIRYLHTVHDILFVFIEHSFEMLEAILIEKSNEIN